MSRRSRRVAAWCSSVSCAVVLVVAGLPGVAAAAPTEPQIKTLPEVIDSLTAWIVGILASVATYYLTVGGVRYLTASEPGDAERAKSSLKNAGIGYALAVLAPVLLSVLQSILKR